MFVIGCHRSGTNLLYDTLLSSGGFAIYRGYLPVYKILIPKFGNIANPANRERIVAAWLRSKGFRRAGVEAGAMAALLQRKATSGGDFICTVMNEIARVQNVQRWAVYDPDNALHIPKIKHDIPEALFVHILRDGRDIALSLNKMGGFRPLPGREASKSLVGTAVYWEWVVRTGRAFGRAIPDDYIEIHYEDLVSRPRSVLANLGEFLGHELDYDRIQQAGLGRLRESNSSFLGESQEHEIRPLQRWKERLSRNQIAELEAAVGTCLEEFGYALATSRDEQRYWPQWERLAYLALLRTKFWVRYHTPLRRLVSLSALELTEFGSGTQTST